MYILPIILYGKYSHTEVNPAALGQAVASHPRASGSRGPTGILNKGRIRPSAASRKEPIEQVEPNLEVDSRRGSGICSMEKPSMQENGRHARDIWSRKKGMNTQ